MTHRAVGKLEQDYLRWIVRREHDSSRTDPVAPAFIAASARTALERLPRRPRRHPAHRPVRHRPACAHPRASRAVLRVLPRRVIRQNGPSASDPSRTDQRHPGPRPRDRRTPATRHQRSGPRVRDGERAVEDRLAQPADGALAAPVDGQPTLDAPPTSLSGHSDVDQPAVGTLPGKIYPGQTRRPGDRVSERQPWRPRRQTVYQILFDCHGPRMLSSVHHSSASSRSRCRRRIDSVHHLEEQAAVLEGPLRADHDDRRLVPAAPHPTAEALRDDAGDGQPSLCPAAR
jgi:hypothetical protein